MAEVQNEYSIIGRDFEIKRMRGFLSNNKLQDLSNLYYPLVSRKEIPYIDLQMLTLYFIYILLSKIKTSKIIGKKNITHQKLRHGKDMHLRTSA
jgi:hypothetical protein